MELYATVMNYSRTKGVIPGPRRANRLIDLRYRSIRFWKLALATDLKWTWPVKTASGIKI